MNSPDFRWNTNAILRGLFAEVLAFVASFFILVFITSVILSQKGVPVAQAQTYAQNEFINHPIWVVAGLVCGVWGGIVTARHAAEQELSHALVAGVIAGSAAMLPLLANTANATWPQGIGALLLPLMFVAGGWWQKIENKNPPPPRGKKQKPTDELKDTTQEPAANSED